MTEQSTPLQRLGQILIVAALASFFSANTHAEETLQLMWDDLQPRLNPLDESKRDAGSPPPIANHSVMGTQQPGEVVPELDGKRVRIPAFVVPLDGTREALTEMLLVPYFGACVHVPPPPPNQIIYIQDADGVPVEKLDLYRPVWATGTLTTETTDHELAQIGYRMTVEKLAVYDPRAEEQRRKQQTEQENR